ncbi:MAG: hypothetical protein ABIV11_07735 [Gemmatimonadaceae bacterium]
MRDQAGRFRKDGRMKSPVTVEAQEDRPFDHLSLASATIQFSLPVSDTPALVEELLEGHLAQANEYLREFARPLLVWRS